MSPKIISLILAATLTVSVGCLVPMGIDHFNDNVFGSITIIDDPALITALRDVQAKGVLMGLHGWKHENYSALTPIQAQEATERGLRVLDEAGLVPVAFLSPYLLSPPDEVTEAIERTGIPTRLPSLHTTSSSWAEYGRGWRDMKDTTDPRFQQEYARIMQEQPTMILLHVQEWNPCLKRLICEYLGETHQTNITVRIDDIEVNTPLEKVYEMSELLQYDSVECVVYGVIPAGTWRGGDPAIYGLSVNTIFKVYWWFYVLTSFLPLSFFIFWRFTSIKTDKTNHTDDPPVDDPDPEVGELVSIIVPAYNEEHNIGQCIEAILQQDFKGEMELIVVNDGSSDRTAEIASRYPVTVLNLKTNQGKAHALNTGIKNAKGNILIFSDSDSQMSRDAVRTLVNCLKAQCDVYAVAGNVFIKDLEGKNTFLTYFQMIEYRMEQEITRYLQGLGGKVLVCPGPLFAVRREVIEDLLFSDRSVIEDADFTLQVLRKPMKVVQAPEAKVYTHAPDSLQKWLIQRKRWWYGNLQLWRIHNHWAKRNPWMILNYSGYITSTCSVVLLLLLPFFISTYNNLALILLRGMAYVIIPMLLFTLFVAFLFVREKKLLIMLLPYALIYTVMKAVLVSYLYIRYLSGTGVHIKFGPRIIAVRR
jgi:cellulose synthase/poly-beta-1,6-N-acetylglucosamine synthase-like glycosyltransferase